MSIRNSLWKFGPAASLATLTMTGCASTPNARLFQAVKSWEVEDARAALDAGADPNMILTEEILGGPTSVRDTPILVFAIQSRPTVADILLQRGADVNRPDANGTTPLIAALANNQAPRSLTTAILKRRPDVNARTRWGDTALLRAAKHDGEAVDMELLKRGADVRVRDNDGRDALFYAASLGKSRTVSALLRKGLNPRRRDNHGETAIDFARRSHYSNSKTVQILSSPRR